MKNILAFLVGAFAAAAITFALGGRDVDKAPDYQAYSKKKILQEVCK